MKHMAVAFVKLNFIDFQWVLLLFKENMKFDLRKWQFFISWLDLLPFHSLFVIVFIWEELILFLFPWFFISLFIIISISSAKLISISIFLFKSIFEFALISIVLLICPFVRVFLFLFGFIFIFLFVFLFIFAFISQFIKLYVWVLIFILSLFTPNFFTLIWVFLPMSLRYQIFCFYLTLMISLNHLCFECSFVFRDFQ